MVSVDTVNYSCVVSKLWDRAFVEFNNIRDWEIYEGEEIGLVKIQ